jgi:hypothetical protein
MGALRPSRPSILLALLIALALPAVAPAAAPPPAPKLPALNGLGFGVDEDWDVTRVPLKTQVTLASSLYPASFSNRVARLFACWCEMETPNAAGPPRNFNRIQNAYDALVAAGIHPVISVIGSPWQYSGGVCNQNTSPCFAKPVGHDTEWQAFWSQLALQFPDAIPEVWNEPNLVQFWQQSGGGVSPEDYANLLNLAYDAIKQQRPSMPVLGASIAATGVSGPGGLGDADFLPRFFAAHPRFDGLSIKPFAGPAEPWTYDVRAKVRRVEALRDAAGFGAKKIWVVNMGLSDGGAPNHAMPTEAEQGIGLASAYRSLANDPDVAAILVFRLIDTLNPDPWEAHLGLWKYNTANPQSPIEKSNTDKLTAAVAAGPYPDPTVQISTPSPTVGINQTATFTASGFPSYPNPLGGVTYQWDTDGNGTPEPSTAGTGPSAQRKYTKVGTYKVTVTASDKLELASASTTITVQPGPVKGVDKVAPTIKTLALSSFAFHAARSGGSVAKVSTGTTVRFASDEQGVVTRFSFQRAYPGRVVAKKCKRQTRANIRGHKRCTYYANLKGFFDRYTKKGVNSFRFTGRLRNRALPKARYRMSAQATDTSKNRGKVKRTLFKIV